MGTASTNAAPEASTIAETTDAPGPRERSVPRVLVVRPSALGDVFRTAPALVTLRRALPEARIECLLQEGLAAALAHHPDVDGVISFERRSGQRWYGPRRLRALWEWGAELARRQYDMVIDLQGLARSGIMTWLTRAPRRIGFANARELAWLFYNRRHHADAALHHVDRLLALLEAEGFPSEHDARLYVGDEDDAWCRRFLEERGWTAYTCLAPTSRWRSKCWPAERFVEIGRRLIDAGAAGGRLVVLHAPNERQYVVPLVDALRRAAGATDRVEAPATTVGQMMALVRRCALVLCNDSAVAHAAVGFGRPMACVLGPTDPALIGPYRRSDAVVRPDTEEGLGSLGYYRRLRDDQSLISRVTVDEVWDTVRSQLSGRRAGA